MVLLSWGDTFLRNPVAQLLSVQKPADEGWDALTCGFLVCISMGIKAALPKYEIYFYNTVLCLAMFWAASWIFEVSCSEYENTHTQIHAGIYIFSL